MRAWRSSLTQELAAEKYHDNVKKSKDAYSEACQGAMQDILMQAVLSQQEAEVEKERAKKARAQAGAPKHLQLKPIWIPGRTIDRTIC